MKRFHRIFKLIIINILVLFVILVILEIGAKGYYHFMIGPAEKVHQTETRIEEANTDLGKWNKRSSSGNVEKFCGSELCYQAKYTTDFLGRRIVAPSKDYKQHVFLFGGSYIYGEGLRDEQTVAYKLQQHVLAETINYGTPGAGPAMTLRMFDIDMIQSKQKKGVALYFLPSFHVDRMTMKSNLPWLWNRPGYLLKENELYNVGAKNNVSGIKREWIEFISWINNHSQFVKLFNPVARYQSYSDDLLLMTKVLKRIQYLYEQKFDGDFFVVVMPSVGSEIIGNVLRNHSLKVVEIPESDLPREKKTICKCDRHPSDAYTSYIVEHLLPELKNIKSEKVQTILKQ